MKKSVYSLVLMDDVVEKIDEIAYSMGTSRSDLINRILAEKVSYVTPKERIRHVFSLMYPQINKPFIIQSQPEDTTFLVRRALKYKYNPTIRYSVEIYSDSMEYAGAVRVGLRTQNAKLISLLDIFFNFLCKLETAYTGKKPDDFYEIEETGFLRKIPIDYAENEEELSSYIVRYINLLDALIQYYFTNLNGDNLFANIEKIYAENLVE